MSEPLDRITSIKVKLGLLVAASVVVAAVLATLGAGAVPPWLSVPVTVLLALAVTQLLAAGMTAPLRQMTAAVRRMAAGDYAVRVDTSSTDEVGELARSFNRMAADLAGVDRQRRELVATVSHELRTPLAGLIALLENVADGVARPDTATVRAALERAERLSDLVEDLLDLSRVDAGAAPLDREPVDLAALVARAVREAGSERGVTFAVEVPAGTRAEADPRRLHQLLANLLDNASRHSPADGVVGVRAGAAPDRIWLEVTDQGPGIPAAARERVFERYGTADPTAGGTGLGLAIARWVAELHGGSIRALDATGESGARLRVELPVRGPGEDPVTRPPRQVPAAESRPIPAPDATVDLLFGRRWPDEAVPARPLLLLACLGVGVLAGATLPVDPFGLATTLVLLGAGGVVLAASRHRRDPFGWTCVGLCACLAVLPLLRAAEWLVVLGVLTGALLSTTALVRARSAGALVAGALAWPLAGLRGLPWLGRTLRAVAGRGRRGASTLALVRTVLLGLTAVLVFGALLASADAVMGRWVAALVPELGDATVARAFVTVGVTGVVLAAAYLAVNPPEVEPAGRPLPTRHRFEWLAPVLLVDGVLAVFLAAQAAAFFGGHDYVRRTTGLSYADYVHQGFAQLTVATLLMLAVTWLAARKARTDSPGDRCWLRVSLGLLCLLTLVVVGSALHRMALYQDAYGFTRLRLVVDLFEGWLGLVVLGVLLAGVRLRAAWLPRAAVLSGAVLVLGLAAANPDAWIARQNIDRYQQTGKVDWDYLRGLSADATPTILDRLGALAGCALADEPARAGTGSWTAWNLGRSRAARRLEDLSARARLGSGACTATAQGTGQESGTTRSPTASSSPARTSGSCSPTTGRAGCSARSGWSAAPSPTD